MIANLNQIVYVTGRELGTPKRKGELDLEQQWNEFNPYPLIGVSIDFSLGDPKSR